MTHAVWDYIFQDAEFPADCGVPEAPLAEMRRSFK